MTAHKPTEPEARGHIPMDQQRVDALEDWSVPSGFTDPRGMTVITTDGQKMGTVTGLLGSPSSRQACFAVIDNGSRIAHHSWAMPVEMISVHDGAAHVPVTHHRFSDAPNVKSSAPDYDLIHAYWTGRPMPESD